MYLSDVYTVGVNLAGLPAISVPVGADSKGLPIGVQLISRWWDEESILRCGKAIEYICKD
jgi:aspartyl-tRNA(Asn)/glutamyl-tRNA(Gln) amidotransferase subunit A